MRRQELPAPPTPAPAPSLLNTASTPGTSVIDPANSPTPTDSTSYVARVLRADQGVLTAAVLLPNTQDLKGTAYTPETIKVAMDGFTAKPQIGVEHKGKPLSSGVTHLSSWQTTEDTDFDGNSLPAGTWMMMVIVSDPDLWAKVEKGELNGLSIQGTAMINADAQLAESKHRFSSTQINLCSQTANRILDFGRSLIDDDDLIDVTGRENEPHITLLYGLHTINPDDVVEILEGESEFEVEMGRVRFFSSPDSDVVYIEVFSDQLLSLNRKLSTLPHTSTHPTYSPHITLAYLKKDRGIKYDGRADLEGQSFMADSVIFSGRDGQRDWIPLRSKPGLS